MVTRRRRRPRVATVSEKLLTADFPKWKAVVQRSAATLSADSLERARKLQIENRRARSIEQRALKPVAEIILKDPSGRKAHQEAIARLRKVPPKAPRAPRAVLPITPRVTKGSILDVFAPPYGAAWAQRQPSSGDTGADADANEGQFNAFAIGGGDSSYAGAGVGQGFRAVSDLPMAHVRPYFRYSYWWHDSSSLATAHSHAQLKIRAIQFGPSGQQIKFPPDEVTRVLWSDGTGWFEEHQDQGNYVWPGVVQLDFPLVANQYYAIWIYCEVFADDYQGAFSSSSAYAFLNWVQVPFFVVEESEM